MQPTHEVARGAAQSERFRAIRSLSRVLTLLSVGKPKEELSDWSCSLLIPVRHDQRILALAPVPFPTTGQGTG